MVCGTLRTPRLEVLPQLVVAVASRQRDLVELVARLVFCRFGGAESKTGWLCLAILGLYPKSVETNAQIDVICIYTCVHTYTYIYVWRERERERIPLDLE